MIIANLSHFQQQIQDESYFQAEGFHPDPSQVSKALLLCYNLPRH